MKMNSNKNTNKHMKSALGNLLSEKNQKLPTLVPPVLQQVGKLAAGVASVSTDVPKTGSATGNGIYLMDVTYSYYGDLFDGLQYDDETKNSD